MERIVLPNQPTDLPDTTEVRDFDLGDGKYVRVIMEINPEVTNDHFIMTAQAYEMTADGNFVIAPKGYPSRSRSTTHVIAAAALGDTLNLDDAWCRYTGAYDPENPGDIETVNELPETAPYATVVRVGSTGKLYTYLEGFADTIASTKIEDLQQVLATSNVRSGFAFRR